MSDWKEIDDVSLHCSEDNGWCGYCGRCQNHSQWLHKLDEWGDDEQ